MQCSWQRWLFLLVLRELIVAFKICLFKKKKIHQQNLTVNQYKLYLTLNNTLSHCYVGFLLLNPLVAPLSQKEKTVLQIGKLEFQHTLRYILLASGEDKKNPSLYLTHAHRRGKRASSHLLNNPS